MATSKNIATLRLMQLLTRLKVVSQDEYLLWTIRYFM